MVLNRHISHVTLEVAIVAKEVGLDIVTLLSHSSHTLQPLDISIFGAFKAYFRQHKDYWVSKNLNQAIDKQTLAHWISLRLQHFLLVNNIIHGFSSIGIYPLDRTAIDNQMDPSKAYISNGIEVLTATTDLASNNNLKRTLWAQDIPSLLDEKIEDNLELLENSSNAHYFVDARSFDVERSEGVEGVEDVALWGCSRMYLKGWRTYSEG